MSYLSLHLSCTEQQDSVFFFFLSWDTCFFPYSNSCTVSLTRCAYLLEELFCILEIDASITLLFCFIWGQTSGQDLFLALHSAITPVGAWDARSARNLIGLTCARQVPYPIWPLNYPFKKKKRKKQWLMNPDLILIKFLLNYFKRNQRKESGGY